MSALANPKISIDEQYLSCLQRGQMPILCLNLCEDSVGIEKITSSNAFPFLEWGVLLGDLGSLNESLVNQVNGRFFRDGKETNFYYSSFVKDKKNCEKINQSLRRAEQHKKLQNFLFINFTSDIEARTEVQLDVSIEYINGKCFNKGRLEKQKSFNEKTQQKLKMKKINEERQKLLLAKRKNLTKCLLCIKNEIRYKLSCSHELCTDCYNHSNQIYEKMVCFICIQSKESDSDAESVEIIEDYEDDCSDLEEIIR